MKNSFLKLFASVELSTSPPTNKSTACATSKRRFGKKLYAVASAIAIIIIGVAAFLVIPQSNGGVLPLGVHYVTGEKLSYDETTSMSSISGNTSVTTSTTDTLTISVVSFDGQTYVLNNTETSSIGDTTCNLSPCNPQGKLHDYFSQHLTR